jgi:hypothetical protein
LRASVPIVEIRHADARDGNGKIIGSLIHCAAHQGDNALLAGLLQHALAAFDLQLAQSLVGLAIHGRVGAVRGRQIFLIARSVDGVVGKLQRPLQKEVATRGIQRLLRVDGTQAN